MIRFRVHGEPKGKGRPKFSRTGHAYTPECTKAYEAEVAAAFMQSCPSNEWIEKGIPIRVYIRAIYGVPVSDSARKSSAKLSGELRPTKVPDADNVAKVILDAINGLAWHDDAQIVDLRVEKVYGKQPCVEVTIEKIR